MTLPTLVEDGLVVSMAYTLYVEGEILDASAPDQPLQFIQGQGQIIRGLERELYGMAVEEKKNVVVPPLDGYGEVNEEAFIEVPLNRFPPNVTLQPGMQMQMRNPQGQVVGAFVESIAADSVRLNLNHPLAGKMLHFDVQVTALRPASEQELQHGLNG
jgi:FKBP-type peptidyl-prolyl cis-trans isomerase SlyD